MQATQMLVIAIIMPTIVADIGGAAYYTWAAMLYTIGAIVGASSTGVIWSRLGPRRGYALGTGVFALSTAACALAPDIGALIAARTVQGWAGGLVAGSGMALITSLFDARLRTRIIAISQGTFTACHLSGPIVGGVFAAVNWWRGSFWAMVPFLLLFLPLLLQVVHGVSPVVINFLNIIISLGWTIATFTVSGWSGARERSALCAGPVIAFTGLVLLTTFALHPGTAGLVLLAASAFL